LGVQLLYAAPIVGLAWETYGWLKPPFPSHWTYAIYFAGYLVVRTGLASLADRYWNAAPDRAPVPPHSTITSRLAYLAIALAAAVSILTVGLPSRTAAALSSTWFDQHALWAVVLTTFAMSVAIRSAYLWHQARFWGEWSSASIRRLSRTLFIASTVLGAVGLSAATAHFALRDDTFYAVECVWRNSGGAVALAIWWGLWHLALSHASMELELPSIHIALPKTPGSNPKAIFSELKCRFAAAA
jgi:hypothetical protein